MHDTIQLRVELCELDDEFFVPLLERMESGRSISVGHGGVRRIRLVLLEFDKGPPGVLPEKIAFAHTVNQRDTCAPRRLSLQESATHSLQQQRGDQHRAAKPQATDVSACNEAAAMAQE
jgi:hypothetical protein